MKNYKMILFDLDGTLTDPKEGILNSIKYAFHKLNRPMLHESELLKFIGPPIQRSFCDIGQLSEEEIVKAVHYYREYFTQNGMIENNLYNGIPELLNDLQNEGKKLFVATSKPTVFAKEILKHFHLDQFFTEIVGSELDGTRIDKGEIIETIFRENSDYHKNNAVMIGDRSHDIIGAKLANIESIGVTYGYGSEIELTNAGANAIVHDIDSLRKFLILDKKILI